MSISNQSSRGLERMEGHYKIAIQTGHRGLFAEVVVRAVVALQGARISVSAIATSRDDHWSTEWVDAVVQGVQHRAKSVDGRSIAFDVSLVRGMYSDTTEAGMMVAGFLAAEHALTGRKVSRDRVRTLVESLEEIGLDLPDRSSLFSLLTAE